MADPYIGQVKIFAGNFAPRGWALCEGQLLAVSSNNALFSILGTMYGGDGRTTFALPDLRGRCVVGGDAGVGNKQGSETLTLTADQLPSHSHTIGPIHMDVVADDGPHTTPGGRFLSNTDPETYTDTTNSSMPLTNPANTLPDGSSIPIQHRQPYLGLNFIIALFGTYPSR